MPSTARNGLRTLMDGEKYRMRTIPSHTSTRAMDSEECSISSEQVSQYLISNGLYLTGLEFLTEGQELGGFDLSYLQRFFNDTGRFPPEEVQRFQGEDVLSSILMAKEREQKLCLAEYELRVATEDLRRTKTREEQECMAQDDTQTPLYSPGMSSQIDHENTYDSEQRRHLNSVVMAYLMQSGYKVAALTFQEEAFHDFQKAQIAGDTLANYYSIAQATPKHGDLVLNKKGIDALLLETAEISENKTEGNVGSDVDNPKTNGLAIPEAALQNGTALTDGENESECAASMRIPQLSKTGSLYTPSSDILAALMESFPKILPNVLIKRRSECIPLLSTLIRDHPDTGCRQAFLEMLFGLIKHPDDLQRNEMVIGIGLLAESLDSERITREIIPQCCEYANHKRVEKRLLTAEVIGVISRHVEDDIRSSLLLSLLQQLSTDADASVRHAALKSLLSCIKAADVSSRKYQTVEDLLIAFLMDLDDNISRTVLTEVAPLIAKSQCGLQLKLPFIKRLCQEIIKILETSSVPPIVEKMSNVHGAQRTRLPKTTQQKKIHSLLELFDGLLPEIVEICHDQIPFHVVHNLKKSISEDPLTPVADMHQNSLDKYNDDDDRKAIAFERWLDEEEDGKDIRFLLEEVVPSLISCLSRITPCHESQKLRERFSTTFRAMCTAFEWYIVEGGLWPLFLSASGLGTVFPDASLTRSTHLLKLLNQREPEAQDSICLLPICLSAVMGLAGETRFHRFLSALVQSSEKEPTSWMMEHKKEFLAAVIFAGAGTVHEMLMSVVQKFKSSDNVFMRCGAVIICQGLSIHASLAEVHDHITPNVLQLAEDAVLEVRLQVISALQQICIIYPSSRELMSDIYQAVHGFMTAEEPEAKIHALNAFSSAASSCNIHRAFVLNQIPYFLDELRESTPDSDASYLTRLATAVFNSLLVLEGAEDMDAALRGQLVSSMETLTHVASAYLDKAQKQILVAMVSDQTAKLGLPKRRLPHFSKGGKKTSASDLTCPSDS